MQAELTDAEKRELLSAVRFDLVNKLIKAHGEELQLVSRAQAAGILDVTPATLDKLIVLPRVSIGKRVCYRLSDIRHFIESNTEH